MRNSDLRPTRVELAVRPFVEFFHREASAGLVLLAITAVALIWANSPFAASYDALWKAEVAVRAGGFSMGMDLRHLVNDGLMAVFFLLVGLEIKREILVGELSSTRKAALPMMAALGGMVFPALIYVAINLGSPGIRGWGAPMATDIAFALGVLALLGSRAPIGLKVFLTAVAIVDDIGAVLVIALFYSGGIATGWLAASAAVLAAMAVANRLGVRSIPFYLGMFALLWYAVHYTGIHATVAGVLAAMTVPAGSRIDGRRFASRTRALIDEFENSGDSDEDAILNEQQTAALHEIERDSERVGSPLQRLEHALHPWVAFAIVPVFALANAGVSLVGGSDAPQPTQPIAIGLFLGLVLGKPIGIYLMTWLTVRLGLGDLPQGVTWRHIHGAGWLGGIGFTMSLFVATLAFGEGRDLQTAKAAILAASAVAGSIGLWIVSHAKPTDPSLLEESPDDEGRGQAEGDEALLPRPRPVATLDRDS